MPGKKLFVGNLAWTTNTDVLQDAFGRFGNIVDAIVMQDRETGRSRGFGFITFSEANEAEAAIAGLNDSQIDGRQVRVNYATTQSSGGGGGGRPQGGGGFRGGNNNGGGGGYSNFGGGYNGGNGGGYGNQSYQGGYNNDGGYRGRGGEGGQGNWNNRNNNSSGGGGW